MTAHLHIRREIPKKLFTRNAFPAYECAHKLFRIVHTIKRDTPFLIKMAEKLMDEIFLKNYYSFFWLEFIDETQYLVSIERFGSYLV